MPLPDEVHHDAWTGGLTAIHGMIRPLCTPTRFSEVPFVTRALLSGNEAIAHGAWEAGVRIGVGYPGTPSTETLENFVRLPGVYAEWAPNEKVALEVAAVPAWAASARSSQ